MKYLNEIICGDCLELIPQLDDNSIQCCITSPPYAEQRKGLYSGISEEDFPNWMVSWMKALKPKLTKSASVFIVIRPHIKNGEISDYVLRTRLAIRGDGWKECEELIWFKPDAPPLGSIYRPRRTYESILWYSLTGNPFSDLIACGNKKSTRTGGFAGSERFGKGTIVAKMQERTLKKGVSRISDVIQATIGSLPKGVMHPAMFPEYLPLFLIQTYTNIGDTIVDPFMGSGQTALAALSSGRTFVGFDKEPEYVAIATERTKNFSLSLTKPFSNGTMMTSE